MCSLRGAQGVREGAVGAGEAERRRREEAKKALFKGIDIIGEGEGEAMVDDADLPQVLLCI